MPSPRLVALLAYLVVYIGVVVVEHPSRLLDLLAQHASRAPLRPRPDPQSSFLFYQSAYKMHVKLAREQRRLEREDEERRRRREGSASGSSYYSEDDERSKENEPGASHFLFAPCAGLD